MKIRTLIVSGRSLALLFCLSMTCIGAVGQSPSTGQKLVGTWDVTLRFPVAACSPGGVANITIPALHTYSSDGTMEEVSGGTLYRSDALGSWEHLRDQEYAARFKFFIFDPATGALRRTEVVTSRIELQDRDAFEAAATFDLFAADGTPILTACPINITGTRF
jgi:hypothetical protein